VKVVLRAPRAAASSTTARTDRVATSATNATTPRACDVRVIRATPRDQSVEGSNGVALSNTSSTSSMSTGVATR
jgi:hypothetical protein